MDCVGQKSEDDSKLASRKYARIIQKLGFDAKFTDFKIQNIVGSCDIKFPVRLEGLASRHHNFSSYEPELFPGLIYRMIKPKVVLLIFVSGKTVLTGAKVREEIYQAFEMIYPVLQGPLVAQRLFVSLVLFQNSRTDALQTSARSEAPTWCLSRAYPGTAFCAFIATLHLHCIGVGCVFEELWNEIGLQYAAGSFVFFPFFFFFFLFSFFLLRQFMPCLTNPSRRPHAMKMASFTCMVQ